MFGPRLFFGLIWLSALILPAAISVAADPAAVNAAIQRGNASLLGRVKDSAGGPKSLAAYALLKTGVDPSHPAIAGAIADVLKSAAQYAPGSPAAGTDHGFGHKEFAYSVACHMFLLEAADPVLYKPQLTDMAGYLSQQQLSNGSWWYIDPPGSDVGDTSQLQFALLGLWAAQRADVDVSPEVWQKAVNWLLRTQIADGGFCYQPKGSYKQERETSLSCTLAGVGSLLVARQIFYPNTQFGEDFVELAKPKEKRFGVLDRLKDEKERRQRAVRFSIPVATLDKSISRALRIVDERFRVDGDQWLFQMYMLYSMERTSALLDSEMLGKHNWYDSASDEIVRLQLADGGWSDRSGAVPGTSFALLALNKTTSKLLGHTPSKKIGGGLLVGARGLPSDLSKLNLKDGQAVERKSKGSVDDLLSELEKVQDVAVADLQQALLESVNLDDPEQLVGDVARLRRLAADPRADVRRTALWAIGRSGEIRLAPLLLAGLKDVDIDVMREASYGLTVLSRKPTGLTDDRGKTVPPDPLDGLDEDATEEIQQEHVSRWLSVAEPAWRKWYLSVRPYDERDDREELKKKR